MVADLPPTPPLDSTTMRLSRGWAAWGWLAAIVSVTLLCATAGAAMVSSAAGAAGGVALLSWLAGMFVGHRIGGRRRAERGDLRIDAAGLYWNGELLAPRAKIRRALVVPTSKGVWISVDMGATGSFGLEVADVAEGEAVVRALGFGVEARRLDASMISAIGYSGLGYMAALLTAFAVAGAGSALSIALLPKGPALAVGILASVVAMFTIIFWPTQLSIGADGVLVRWMWRERTLRYADIARIERDEWGGVVLVRHDGSRFAIGQIARYGLDVATITERIREAMSLGAAPDRPVASAALGRAGRTVPAWLNALRQLERAAEGGLRQAPVLAEDLWRVLEDPGASESARAGAATALHVRRLEAADRKRLRVAAEAVAARRLRVAIEAAADDDEERLTEALAAIEETEAAPTQTQ